MPSSATPRLLPTCRDVVAIAPATPERSSRSSSGWLERRSTTTNTPAATTDSANNDTVSGDAQPRSGAVINAYVGGKSVATTAACPTRSRRGTSSGRCPSVTSR